MSEATISLDDPELLLSLFGARDQHVRRMREALAVDISHRQGQIRVQGEEAAVAAATAALEEMKGQAERSGPLSPDDVTAILAKATGGETPVPPIEVIHAGKRIKPRTPGQAAYVEAIREHDMVFAEGPAGTGKTYLAVALAAEALKKQAIRKLVLVRPAVEAGERLGFLPGDLQAKINPYLRPLLDALYEMMDYDQVKRLTEQDVIEVIPLAYMRGRTLNDAFIILDEAQNTTVSQMKMFLTRMGSGSKIVVAGDTTQIDLPSGLKSGMIDALARLKKVKGLAVVRLGKADIVRHRLVQQIVDAYEATEHKKKGP